MSTPLTVATTADDQSIPTGRFKPLVSLRQHKWLSFLILITLIPLGMWVAMLLGKPIYQVQATILISPKFVPTLDAEKGMNLSRYDYEYYTKQQIKLITRRDVLQEAFQLPQVKHNWLGMAESEQEAIVRLAIALSADSKRGDPFLTVTLKRDKPQGLDEVLNGVVQAFLKQSQAENLYDSPGRIDTLEKLRKQILGHLERLQKRRTQIAEELGVTTFQLEDANPYDSILVQSRSAFSEARRNRIQAEANLDALDKKQGQSAQTALDALVQELLLSDPTLSNFKSRLTERRAELMTQLMGLRPEHPSRRQAEREIVEIDKEIAKMTAELSQEIRNRLLRKTRAEVYQTQTIEQALKEELEQQQQQANRYVTLYNEALVLNKEIERTYRQLQKIDERIDFLNIEATAPGFLRLYTPARPALYPSEGGPKKILLIFVVAALGLSIALPIGLDLLDRRIRTPAEVHKLLGFAPMGWILERSNRATTRLAQDHLRRMALTLERDWRAHKTHFFVLTSVKPGGGTTTLTLEIAHQLGQLGVRTLAVELNAFQPDERYRDEGTSKTLIQLLAQEVTHLPAPHSLVVPATATLPARLPVGDTPERHLNTQGQLLPLLHYLADYFDIILLDTPPILLSADAELLGEIAGGVLLVVEAGHITPGELKRAAQLLERLNPPVVGSVVNRVKVYRGGGYFSELIKEHSSGTKSKPHLLKRLFLRN